MTIDAIGLAGFQKHRKRLVRLSPHVTTIIGKTNSGKSSLLRALRWLCLNKPPKGRYVHWEMEECFVHLEVDGATIRRSKGKSHNSYTLNKKKYKSFGAGKVPEPIAKLLNVTAINFQRQLDLPFWFMDSAVQIGKSLNEIVNLELIDSSLSKIGKELRQALLAEKIHHKDLEETEQKIQELSWVTALRSKILSVQEISDELENTEKTIARIAPAIENVRRASLERDRSSKAYFLGVETLSQMDELLALDERITRIGNLVKEITSLELIKTRPLPSLKTLDKEVMELERLEQQLAYLEEVLLQLDQQEEELCRLKKSLPAAQKELQECLQERCPLCQQKLKSSPS